MNDMVPIRSVKQYIKEFIVEGMGKNRAKPDMVREQILDSFMKEVWGQIVFRYNDPTLLSRSAESVDDKTREGIRHILDNTQRKYRRLCLELSKHPATYSLLNPDELMQRMKDVVTIQEQERENPGETPVDMMSNEQPVLIEQ